MKMFFHISMRNAAHFSYTIANIELMSLLFGPFMAANVTYTVPTRRINDIDSVILSPIRFSHISLHFHIEHHVLTVSLRVMCSDYKGGCTAE